MSLSVYLYRMDALFPKADATVYDRVGNLWDARVYDANITHNLGTMAKACGIYEALWRPYLLCGGTDASERETIVVASKISPVISKGLARLRKSPDKYKKYDSPNGWGVYVDFVPFVENYLRALEENPDSIVITDR